MDVEKQFSDIKNFLKTHEYLYDMEVLDRYGAEIPELYHRWTNELIKLQTPELIYLLNNYAPSKKLSNGLNNYINQIAELIKLPKSKTSSSDFSQKLKRKVSQKKIHEIQSILGLLEKSGYQKFIDVGSGAGHLSSAILEKHPEARSICVDLNESFQNIGKRKLARWSPKILDRLTFKRAKVDERFHLAQDPNSCIIGLHSCGALSVDLLKIFQQSKVKGLINFGCCYHKMKDEYNLSSLAQNRPLPFSNHALTLAAKGHTIQNEKSMKEKIRVKKFRYLLHFFCMDHAGIRVESIGNTERKDEHLSFQAYLEKYLPCDVLKMLPMDKANEFALSQENLHKFHYFICFGVLRGLLARVIEVYLIMDRFLWLKENGQCIEIQEVFKRELSPRNIGLISN